MDDLVYTHDDQPGWRRVQRGKHVAYLDEAGRPLRDEAALARIRKLAIPPAYSDVWICPLAQGHLQATGRDVRGRKQYRYHADWRARQEDGKFSRLVAFGQALPRIRARVQTDLRSGPAGTLPTRARVLATVVQLLDTTYARVGNDTYARENKSYGLTTLRQRHAEVHAGVLRLRFRGKSGVKHDLSLDDPRVARIVRRCQQLPGQQLFQYIDDTGQAHGIDSCDVNDYLAEAAGAVGGVEASGERFTAKDFRTWHGSVLAWALTRRVVAAESGGKVAARSHVLQLVAQVASRLGNTVAVCRKSYIHPDILAHALCVASGEAANEQAALAAVRSDKPPAGPRGLSADERRLMAFLSASCGAVPVAAKVAAKVAVKAAAKVTANPAEPAERVKRRPQAQAATDGCPRPSRPAVAQSA